MDENQIILIKAYSVLFCIAVVLFFIVIRQLKKEIKSYNITAKYLLRVNISVYFKIIIITYFIYFFLDDSFIKAIVKIFLTILFFLMTLLFFFNNAIKKYLEKK